MIYLYTGTPGSGKSLRVAQIIYSRLRKGKKCIANFNIDITKIKGKKVNKDNFLYLNNSQLSPRVLLDYAKEHHVLGKENQTSIFIDEAQLIFNSREYSQKGRMEWISFFTQHRKLGFNIFLVTQYDKMIDKQMRALVEIEYSCLKMNNFSFGWILPFSLFVERESHYGLKLLTGKNYYLYNKKYGDIYNTYEIF